MKPRSSQVRAILLTLSLCGLAACQSSTSSEEQEEAKELSPVERVIQKLPPVEIELKEITPESLKVELEKHKGKVVLVDYWATWCPICIDTLHHLSEWHLKYADQGLVIITINLDEDNESNRNMVRQYLFDQRAPYETFICTSKPAADAFRKFEIAGETLPFCQIYDRTGKLVVSLGNVDPARLYDERSISAALAKLF